MPNERSRSTRSGRRTQDLAELRQLQRWLDDGGAEASDPPPRLPVMWSPIALSARLEAERAVEALGHRSRVVCVRARTEITRLIAAVDSRRLDMSAAIAQLRDLTARLEQQRLTEQSGRHPRPWQLLRQPTRSAPHTTRHRVRHAAVAGTTR